MDLPEGPLFKDPVRTWKLSDDESLISHIKQNPTLWDATRTDFRNNDKRHSIYVHIAKFYPHSSPRQIERRFFMIKEKLRREKKKEDARKELGLTTKYKQWQLMPKLKFLETTMSPWKTRKTSHEDSSFSPVKNIKLSPSYVAPSPSIDTQCTIDSLQSPGPSRTVSEEFMEQATDTLRQISHNLESLSAQANREKPNHFKVFEYLAQECSEMEPLVRNIFVRDVMELFWKYKLD